MKRLNWARDPFLFWTDPSYQQSSLPDQEYESQVLPSYDSENPNFEWGALQTQQNYYGSAREISSETLSHHQSSSVILPPPTSGRPSERNDSAIYLSRHQHKLSRTDYENNLEDSIDYDYSFGEGVDDDEDDCGSLDDESIDGDLSRFEEIRMGQNASDNYYDFGAQTVAPLVTHRSLASLPAERQKEIVTQFPSLNGTINIPSDGLGQNCFSTDRDPLRGVCSVLWEEEGTICLVVELSGITVTRRCDNNMINGTKLLNSAIITRGRRDGILKGERVRHVVKVGGVEFKGVWIPFERALEMTQREQVLEDLFPLFISNVESILYSPSNLNRLQQMLYKGAYRNPRFLEWMDGIPLPKDKTSINSRSTIVSNINPTTLREIRHRQSISAPELGRTSADPQLESVESPRLRVPSQRVSGVLATNDMFSQSCRSSKRMRQNALSISSDPGFFTRTNEACGESGLEMRRNIEEEGRMGAEVGKDDMIVVSQRQCIPKQEQEFR